MTQSPARLTVSDTVLFRYFALVSNSSSDQNEDLEEVRKAHHLMRKINSATPDLLLNAMPLLQEEMKVDHMNIRQLATETLGEMFAEESSNVAEKYPNIWKTWLGRYVASKQAETRMHFNFILL